MHVRIPWNCNIPCIPTDSVCIAKYIPMYVHSYDSSGNHWSNQGRIEDFTPRDEHLAAPLINKPHGPPLRLIRWCLQTAKSAFNYVESALQWPEFLDYWVLRWVCWLEGVTPKSHMNLACLWSDWLAYCSGIGRGSFSWLQQMETLHIGMYYRLHFWRELLQLSCMHAEWMNYYWRRVGAVTPIY